METIQTVTTKYNRFKDAEIRSLYTPDDTSVVITLAVQNDDAEDIAKIKVTCDNITDKRLLVNEVLPFLDMMSGVSMFEERNLHAFAIGQCDTMLHVVNAPLYVVCKTLTIEEEVL